MTSGTDYEPLIPFTRKTPRDRVNDNKRRLIELRSNLHREYESLEQNLTGYFRSKFQSEIESKKNQGIDKSTQTSP